nr:hypothetical protein [Tanacetum cinerariifolium]
TMADVNVNAPADQTPIMAPPTRTDDQILPHIKWVPIGKSKCYLDVEKSQSNPIYKIAFGDIVRYDKTAGCYKCQLDEQWFDLTKDTLIDALQITPVNNNKAFSSTTSSDALINFVNDLGYPKVVRNLSNVVTNDMFQLWRTLTTIINLCLTGKTLGFERPRAPRKHKFHPRPDSLLHFPNKEPVLGYLKFSAKGTKREVFGMPIPGNLIIADIQGEPYYQEYLEKVAKHQRYLAGEQGSDPNSHAPKPAKATKKSKSSAPKADLRPPPSPARRSKPGLVTKRHKPTSSLRSVDESVAEGIPEKEPRFDDVEADVQRALEESLKSIYDASRGLLPPVVIKESESVGNINRFQRFRERAKRKFTKLIIYYLQRKHMFYPRLDSPLHLPNEEPVLGYLKFSAKGTKQEVFGMPISGNLITADIQGNDPDPPAPKPTKATKKSKPSVPKGKKRKLVTETSDKPFPAKKSRHGLVTKRRKPTSSLSSVDESVAEGIPEKEPRFDDEEDDVQRALEESLKSIYDAPQGPLPPVVIREPESGKYQPLLKDESSSLYAELGLTYSEVESDEDLSPVVHAGPNLKHTDLEVTDVSTQPHLKQMDEGFTATAYPKVHGNLKITVKEQVILEEPASSTGTLSSLQHLAKDLSFCDLIFNDKPSEADNEKTTTETKAESMVSVTIQQDTSVIPPMTTPIVDLTSRPNSPNVHRPLQATATETTTTTTHPPRPQPQKSTIDSMLMKCIGELEHITANLIQDNKHLEERLDSHGARLYTLENLDIPQDLPKADMKEILHRRMGETNSYKTHKDHMMLYEALEKSMNRDCFEELLKDLAEARKKKKKRSDSPKMPPGSPPHQPPPPLPPVGPSGTSRSLGASRSSQVLPPPPPPPFTNQEGQSHGSVTPSSSKTAASAEYQAWTMTDTRLRLWKPLEEDRPATPEPAWSIPSSDLHVPKNNWAPALASTYSPPSEDSLLAQTGDMAMFMDWFCKRQGITKLKPQELEGPAVELVKVFHPNVTIQSDFFFNKDLEYMRYGSKGSRLAFSILKMKAAYYLDVGLEQMVPDQMWINEECKYDIAAMYGISHWWFQRQRFYIDRHTSKGDRRAVRTHMLILSVVKIEVFSIYGVQMIMLFNEIHKFSDGTLHQIDEALDYRVKVFKVNRMNSSLNKRFGLGRMWIEARSSCSPFKNGKRLGGSSVIWKTLLVDESEMETTDF